MPTIVRTGSRRVLARLFACGGYIIVTSTTVHLSKSSSLDVSPTLAMLPVELIREIIFCYVDDATPEKPTSLVHPHLSHVRFNNRSKADSHSFSSLSLVSKVFREITLQAWFQTFVMRVPTVHLTGLSTIPGVAQWTSVKTGLWLGLFSVRRSLMAFVRLRKLRIDAFPSDHSYILLEMLEELPLTVVELELRYLAWPSPQQLVPAATLLPNLRVLEMHQESAWCSLCNTCRILRLKDDSVSITYTNGDGLPVRAPAFLGYSATHPVNTSQIVQSLPGLYYICTRCA
ncbi:uncharacterized protein C8Q71DRAFT_714715 [Rhodofomes roseus]|uniref:F-box domain-containing protein n=1 Tax=Rhodofomes roseus TaxID=34475 RepID=A0ABQ8K4P5_9APHY|nr:uncharacterized protein C8Q71DRAFT_714715 [Rhodofomes roseus]KAH9831932.1 hypothetical protein C8Q71DRAFT_714715 [Rhodofomes roseus]